jgi:hypothetical protein
MNSFSGIKSVEGEDNIQTSTCIVTTLKHPHPFNCLSQYPSSQILRSRKLKPINSHLTAAIKTPDCSSSMELTKESLSAQLETAEETVQANSVLYFPLLGLSLLQTRKKAAGVLNP